MKEIEAKILEIDPEELCGKLEGIGASKVFEDNVKSDFYDFEDGRIEENGQIRLRTIGDHSFVTRKIDVDDERAKVKEEIEFDVENPDEVRKFLKSIGLEKIESGEKKRAKWQKNSVEYVIDRYPGIPPLLEIEAPSHQKLEKAFEDLGYRFEETVDWGSSKLHRQYDVER
jgi:adenylate cyclase class 2